MGRELSDHEGIHEGDNTLIPQDDKAILQDSPTSKEGIGNKNLVEVLNTTLNHYFPRLGEWLDEVIDSRNRTLITYDLKTILWTALFIMITQRGARYHIHHQMRVPQILFNLKTFSDQDNLITLPHGDTVEYSRDATRR